MCLLSILRRIAVSQWCWRWRMQLVWSQRILHSWRENEFRCMWSADIPMWSWRRCCVFGQISADGGLRSRWTTWCSLGFQCRCRRPQPDQHHPPNHHPTLAALSHKLFIRLRNASSLPRCPTILSSLWRWPSSVLAYYNYYVLSNRAGKTGYCFSRCVSVCFSICPHHRGSTGRR